MLTAKQGYICCIQFLYEFWKMNKALYDDDLPILLGNMQLAGDGKPFDPAMEQDWNNATLAQGEMTIEDLFESMICFLNIYVDLGEADTKDITRLLQDIEVNRSKHFTRWVSLAKEVTGEDSEDVE